MFPIYSWNVCQRIEILGIEGWSGPRGPWSLLYVSSVCTRQSSSLGLLFNFLCFPGFRVPLFSETVGCRPPLEDRSLWRWDCLSYASVWRGASVTAHRTVGFRFLGWQELQSLLCSWGFFPWLAHLDATQASCVLWVVANLPLAAWGFSFNVQHFVSFLFGVLACSNSFTQEILEFLFSQHSFFFIFFKTSKRQRSTTKSTPK